MNIDPLALLGTLITGLVVYYVKRRIDDHRAFRSVFAGDLSTLREMKISKSDSDVFHFLQSNYPRHEAAYLEFLHALGWDFITKRSLCHRWTAYRGKHYGDLEDQQYRLAHFTSVTEEDERQKRDEAIRLIENLIA